MNRVRLFQLKETIEFLKEVEMRPALWDTSHHLFNDKKVCNAIWEVIGTKFNVNGPNARIRWKALRDCFRKELAKSPLGFSGSKPGDYNSTWHIFRYIFFVKDQFKEPSGLTSSPRRTIPVDQIEPVPSTSKQSNTYEDDDVQIIETTHDAFVNEFPKALQPKPIVTYPCENNYDGFQREGALESINPDVGFLASLLPHMNDIPPERKFSVKQQLLNVIVQHLHERDPLEPFSLNEQSYQEESVEIGHQRNNSKNPLKRKFYEKND